jgi:hypothetical protein
MAALIALPSRTAPAGGAKGRSPCALLAAGACVRDLFPPQVFRKQDRRTKSRVWLVGRATGGIADACADTRIRNRTSRRHDR